MKIAIVIPSYFPRWGGAENQARRQAREFVKRGHEVEIVTWKRDPGLPDREFLDGALVHRVDRWKPGPLHTALAFARMSWLLVTVAKRVDVIAAYHLMVIAYLAGFVCRLTRTPVVSRPAAAAGPWHTDLAMLSERGLAGRMRRFLALPLRYGAAIALSSTMAADLRALGFRHIVQIPNGIEDPGPVDRGRIRAELCASLGIPEGAPLVVAAGRLVEQKGFDVFLDAWPRIQSMVGDAQAVIVGSGPNEARLRAQASATGMDRSIHFVTASPRAQDFIAAADVVVIPSRFEGLSNVLLETMMAGVPMVGTPVSGTLDLIRDGINGRLVAVDDAGALAQAVLDVLRNPGDMGRRARETVLAQCEMQHVIDRLLQLFTSVAGPAPEGDSGEVGRVRGEPAE